MRTKRVGAGMAGIALFVFTNGPVFHVATRWLDGRVAWEEPVTRATFVVVSVIGIVGLVLGVRRPPHGAFASPAAVAIGGFVGMALASTVWSIDPAMTLGRSFVYVGMAAWAWLLASLGPTRTRAAMVVMVAPAVVLSALQVAFGADGGRDPNGDWRGIYLNRNSLAPLCAIGVILGLGLVADASARRRSPASVAPGAALTTLSGVLLVGAGSRTAWIALVAAAAVVALTAAGAVIRRARPGAARALILGGGAALAAVAVTAFGLAADEATFVQRRHIWSFAWDRIRERPVVGHGWFTVWATPDFVGDDPLLRLGNAHNSALDVLLGTGAVGLVFAASIVGLATVDVFRSVWREPGVDTLTGLAVVIVLLVENLTESFVLMYSYNWVLLMAFAAASGIGWPTTLVGRTRRASAAAIG